MLLNDVALTAVVI